VRESGVAERVSVYVGSYGANATVAAQVHALPGALYAPMFPVQPGWYWEKRRLPPKDEEFLVGRRARSARYAGGIPAMPRLLTLAPNDRLLWGIELGARFRDAIRQARGDGIEVDSWQFDEVIAQCLSSRPLREFVRGVFRGLTYGRPDLGDRAQRGFVWVAHTALALAGRKPDLELSTFWRMLNRAAFRFVGEEYPNFAGDAARAARTQAAGQRALAAGGPARQALARKYVPGMTPGYHLAGGLGGNVNGWPRAQVNSWRSRYLAARAATGVAGFAEFDFRSGNRNPTVMQDVLVELARYL
jgi:hypothetical protein